jgi:ferritin
MPQMISDAMVNKLNDQIANELGASHSYLAMACTFETMGLVILSKRFMQQSDEERDHALKILHYIQEVGGNVKLKQIAVPKADYKQPIDIIRAALDSELTVTKQINALMALADKEKDYATRSFLQWFVDEQVEEVSSMRDLLQLTERAKDILWVENRVRHDMETK